MSSFGAKRKARIIQTLDDEGDDLNSSLNSGGEDPNDYSAPQGRIKFGRNKPAKSSSLRKSIIINHEDDSQTGSGGAPTAISHDDDDDDDDGPTAPVVIRPTLGRAGSSKQKKRAASSRLSFGPSEGAAVDDDPAAASSKPVTPKRSLGQRMLQGNALRKSASLQNLTSNLPMRFGGDEERPRYSKEYLEELQSSTPNTPQNLSSLQIHDGDEMELDPSELEGALVVQSTDVATRGTKPPTTTQILTEAEIRERKERRARLAKEAEYISLEGGSEDEDGQGGARLAVQFPRTSKKKESRLIAEDEDLGEGYDEFVSDGGLALGRKAEREAARRHRQEMADLIKAAEDGSEAECDDSEAERRAAYEAAQRRAGMDGLQRYDQDLGMDAAVGPDAIPRMKPLPKLNEVLQRMREIVQGLEDEVTRKRARIDGLKKEKEEILAREKEVQEILNEAGAKYQAVVNGAGGAVRDVSKLASQSPLRPFPPGIANDLPLERGLESFGTTPTKRDDVEEMA
ncbi:Nineteen complex-related protein 2-domain-containing protein [Madurella fahalii]|uniref:Nineteen complex-related protein 2-domain-containing protein n=1 Tax=Madurella fahalii TaxID=1157608 RepID=A0ABQ0FWG1_9PEZI